MCCWTKMFLKPLFHYLFLCKGLFVLGTVINSQEPGTSSTIQIHCLSNKDVIQITSPFNNSWISDNKFISMEWYRYQPSVDGGMNETLLLQFLPNKTISEMAKFSVFQFWGLQVNDVGLDDSATYTAKFIHLSQRREWSVHVVVAAPPVIASEKLSVSRTVSADGRSKILSCGRMGSLGSPPINFVWKTDSGTVLPSVYQDGYLQLTLASEDDTGKHKCDLDMSAPAAKCILSQDLPRFTGAVTQSSKSESANMFDIIAGVVAAAIFVLIIIIIVVFVVKRRVPKSEVYNAREHEKKRDQENGYLNVTPHLKDEENLHGGSQTSIHNGPSSPDAFTISKASEGNTVLNLKKTKPQVLSTKDTAYLNGKRSPPSDKPDKIAEGKDKRKQESDLKRIQQKVEEQPPLTKPRQVFLTPSMEELDKVIRNANDGTSNFAIRQGLGTTQAIQLRLCGDDLGV